MKGLLKADPVKEEPQPYIDCTGNLQVLCQSVYLYLLFFFFLISNMFIYIYNSQPVKSVTWKWRRQFFFVPPPFNSQVNLLFLFAKLLVNESFGSPTQLETPKLLAESPCLPKWEADAKKSMGKQEIWSKTCKAYLKQELEILGNTRKIIGITVKVLGN